VTSALIGHTGLVGGNLLAQAPFEARFNSSNIESIRGSSFDLVVCAGARAVKWQANKEPEADRANIERLIGCLEAVEARRFVLISTVDVYPDPVRVDERTEIDAQECQPYGRHRFELERFARRRFEATIVRLPGLFGDGLKKNVIYDLLHSNRLDLINARSVFQFYSLDRLWRDIERTLAEGISLVNFATEPTNVKDLAREGFGIHFVNRAAPPPAARYDMRSVHARKFGGARGYLYDKRSVLDERSQVVERTRKATA
jgi:nucleoside-diphosphate-sugar epimerase